MSTLRNVPKSDWRGFLDGISKAMLGARAEIEVAALDLGDQVLAEWVPALGVTYEPNDDVVDIALDSGSHLIHKPCALVAQESRTGLEALTVTDEDGARHTVRLKVPLQLPATTSR